MIGDPCVNPAAEERICAELDNIEHQQGARIVLAVESGSRAWGFPSRDSDFDVRFLYVRPVDYYLCVTPRPDVIERHIDSLLDINGWDLRKALQLLIRSNAVLLEWLTSPIRYRQAEAIPARLHDLARSSANLAVVLFHYHRLAQRSFEGIVSAGNAVPLKTYCYAIRAALAMAWIRSHGEPPPMDLPRLTADMALGDELLNAISELLEKKRNGTEHDVTQRIPVLDAAINRALAQPVQPPETISRRDTIAQADALFASLVLASSRS